MEINSPVHRWNPELKMASLVFLIFAGASAHNVKAVLLFLTVSLGTSILARIPLRYLLIRVRRMMFFLFPLVFILLLTAGGTEFWLLYNIKLYHSGAVLSFRIVCIAIAVVVMIPVIFETQSFHRTVKVFKNLHIPDTLVTIIILTWRYLFIVYDDLQNMKKGLRLRGFALHFRLRDSAVLASIVGSLMVRSFDRSERLHRAMVLRGYPGNRSAGFSADIGLKDILGAMAAVIMSGIIIWINVYA